MGAYQYCTKFNLLFKNTTIKKTESWQPSSIFLIVVFCVCFDGADQSNNRLIFVLDERHLEVNKGQLSKINKRSCQKDRSCFGLGLRLLWASSSLWERKFGLCQIRRRSKKRSKSQCEHCALSVCRSMLHACQLQLQPVQPLSFVIKHRHTWVLYNSSYRYGADNAT